MRHLRIRRGRTGEILGFSLLTCVQQSVMNLGILMVQGLVNSFGTVVMAAFAAAVKIDAFAYMPVQDFGNAFSTFIAQNYGAGEQERIRRGLRGAVAASMAFCLVISAGVCIFARPLMLLFVEPGERAILAEGVRYLRVEGAFYCGIGCLFLFYGLYRALGRPGMSVVLTVVSLGTRVALAYGLYRAPSPPWGWREFGGRCPSAGAWPTWRAISTTAAIRTPCFGPPERPPRRTEPGLVILQKKRGAQTPLFYICQQPHSARGERSLILRR